MFRLLLLLLLLLVFVLVLPLLLLLLLLLLMLLPLLLLLPPLHHNSRADATHTEAAPWTPLLRRHPQRVSWGRQTEYHVEPLALSCVVMQ